MGIPPHGHPSFFKKQVSRLHAMRIFPFSKYSGLCTFLLICMYFKCRRTFPITFTVMSLIACSQSFLLNLPSQFSQMHSIGSHVTCILNTSRVKRYSSRCLKPHVRLHASISSGTNGIFVCMTAPFPTKCAFCLQVCPFLKHGIYIERTQTRKESTQKVPRHRKNLHKQGLGNKEFKQRGPGTEGMYTKSPDTKRFYTEGAQKQKELAHTKPRHYTERGQETERKEPSRKEPRHTSNLAKQGPKQKESTETKP